MSKNIEIEAKAMIDEVGYKKLMSTFESKDNHSYIQDNYYIDTEDFAVVNNGMGMRIRKKDDYIELTIKDKLDEGKLEINQKITSEEFNDFLNKGIIPDGEVLSYLKKKIDIDVKTLKSYALLSTVRLDIKYKKSLISIDKSSYLGLVDYEVEAESDSMENARKDLFEFLEKEKISYSENTVSKLKRTREEYLRKRNGH